MYQLLLCWRYLRTRYIALASIVSVTLGVATMIVVNAVMAGFAHEMHKRIHGILSDVVVESLSLNGFYDPDTRMREIEKAVGDKVEVMTETVSVPAMVNFRYAGQWITRPVTLVGLPENRPLAGEVTRYLQHPKNREQLSFNLHDGGYDVIDHQAGPEAAKREEMHNAGWPHRRWKAEREKGWPESNGPVDPQNHMQAPPDEAMRPLHSAPVATAPGELPANGPRVEFGSVTVEDEFPGAANPLVPAVAASAELEPGPLPPEMPLDPLEPAPPARAAAPPMQLTGGQEPQRPSEIATPTTLPRAADPFAHRQPEEAVFDPTKQQEPGTVMGWALSTYRGHDGRDHFLVMPGDDIKITMPTAGTPPRAVDASFTVVDLYESKMNEYDSSFVFIPLKRLQQLRGMIDPLTGIGNVTSIQIRLKNPADGPAVRDALRKIFPPGVFGVYTWQDKQGPLLAAVQMETAILNVLLFMIIAVAGFGILAIFYMIVVEKTRDIGILKALGATGRGVQGIFLGYGFSLGIVGSGAGAILGLLFVRYINEIADGLGWLTGQEVFDPTIYYFYEIPAIVDPFTVSWIVAGAVGIAVLASVLPARRAAGLHPVEALRYE